MASSCPTVCRQPGAACGAHSLQQLWSGRLSTEAMAATVPRRASTALPVHVASRRMLRPPSSPLPLAVRALSALQVRSEREGHGDEERPAADSRRWKPKGRGAWSAKGRGGRGDRSFVNLPLCTKEELCKDHSTNVARISAYFARGGDLHAMVLRGIKPNLLNHAILWQTDTDRAREILLAMMEEGVSNEHSLVSFFRGCTATGNHSSALSFWRQMEGPERALGPIASNALLHTAVANKGSSVALGLLREMEEKGCRVTIECYNLVFSHCAKVRDLDGAVRLYGWLKRGAAAEAAAGGQEGESPCHPPRPDKYTFSALLQAVVRSDRLDLLYDIHQAMLQDGVEVDPYLLSSLAAAYSRDGKFEEAATILEELSYKWPEARAELRSGFNSVLAAYGRAGRFEEAAAVYKGKMMGKVLRPDEITYTSLLNAAYRSRSQPLEVVQWLREEAAGVEPTVEMLTAMLNCYRSVTGISDDERLRQVELLYDAIVSAGLRPTTTTHNSVMTAHLEYGTAEGAIEHFPLMQESGAVPDEISFKILIQAYESKNDPEMVEEMLRLRDSMRLISGGGKGGRRSRIRYEDP